jgi:hypothetical protein
MTVRQLLDVLNALPADCLDLPVLVYDEYGSPDMNSVQINPPRNYANVSPCVILRNVNLGDDRTATEVLTYARHS